MENAPTRLTTAMPESYLTEAPVRKQSADSGVQHFIMEPIQTQGSDPNELPRYEAHSVDWDTGTWGSVERDFAHIIPKAQHLNMLDPDYADNGDGVNPNTITSMGFFGGRYYGGNETTLITGGGAQAAIEVVLPRVPLDQVHSLLFTNPWHYMCVATKAASATKMGYYLKPVRKMQKGISNTPIRKFKEFEDRMYERQGKDLSEVFREASQDYFSTGNMNLEIVYTLGGTVDSIYSVPTVTCFKHASLPLFVQRSYPPESFVQPTGERIVVMPRFMSGLEPADYIDLVPEDQRGEVGLHEMMMECNTSISTDYYYGMAEVLSVLTDLFGDNAANNYNLQFFRNNAVPRYAVTISGGRVTEEVVSRITNFLATKVKGQGHRSIVIPLNRGFEAKFERLDAGPNEASFLAYKRLNREEIAAIHGVPPTEVGIWEDANRSNGAQQAKNYYTKVINPHQHKMSRMMNYILQYGLQIYDCEFKWREIDYTNDNEMAVVLQLRAQARASNAIAVRQRTEAVIQGKINGIYTEDEARVMIDKFMNESFDIIDDIDF